MFIYICITIKCKRFNSCYSLEGNYTRAEGVNGMRNTKPTAGQGTSIRLPLAIR